MSIVTLPTIPHIIPIGTWEAGNISTTPLQCYIVSDAVNPMNHFAVPFSRIKLYAITSIQDDESGSGPLVYTNVIEKNDVTAESLVSTIDNFTYRTGYALSLVRPEFVRGDVISLKASCVGGATLRNI